MKPRSIMLLTRSWGPDVNGNWYRNVSIYWDGMFLRVLDNRWQHVTAGSSQTALRFLRDHVYKIPRDTKSLSVFCRENAITFQDITIPVPRKRDL